MEQTIPKPLSGTEVIKAILYDVEQALLLDGRLAPHLAFNGFAFRMTMHVDLPGSPRPEFDRDVSGSRGPEPTAQEAATGTGIDVTAERQHEPPNDQRYATEQPIPVLVPDERGGTKEVMKSYVGKDRKGKTRNIVSGGARNSVPRPSQVKTEGEDGAD